MYMQLQDGCVMFGAALPDVAGAIAPMLTLNGGKLPKAMAAHLASRHRNDMLARVCCDVLKRCVCHGEVNA